MNFPLKSSEALAHGSGFILPTALTRLMRKLRGLGLDTVILKEGLPRRELVEQAEREDRSHVWQSK